MREELPRVCEAVGAAHGVKVSAEVLGVGNSEVMENPVMGGACR
ncbi:hypothetical protein [Amycolatopsis japonica]